MIETATPMTQKPMMMPAKAKPLPPCLCWEARIRLRATKPKITARTDGGPKKMGTTPTHPQTSDAMASPLAAGAAGQTASGGAADQWVPCGGGCPGARLGEAEGGGPIHDWGGYHFPSEANRRPCP